MSELQRLVHGEENWDFKVNKIIEYLESGEPISGLKWSKWSTEGLIYNGVKPDSNMKGYRYAQFPNGKLVELDVKLHTNGIKGGFIDNAMIIPDSIKAINMELPVIVEVGGFHGNLANTGLLLFRDDGNANAGWKEFLLGHALYFHEE
jgi:hypothetical protein